MPRSNQNEVAKQYLITGISSQRASSSYAVYSRSSKWTTWCFMAIGSRTCWRSSIVRSIIATVTWFRFSLMAFLRCWIISVLPLYTLSFSVPRAWIPGTTSRVGGEPIWHLRLEAGVSGRTFFKDSATRYKFFNPNGWHYFTARLGKSPKLQFELTNLRKIFPWEDGAKTGVSTLRSLPPPPVSTWWRYKKWHITKLINIMPWPLL